MCVCVLFHDVSTIGGSPLNDDMWHVTDYYENIRQKVKNLDKDLGDCYTIEGSLPARMCNTPMKVCTTQKKPAAPCQLLLDRMVLTLTPLFVHYTGKNSIHTTSRFLQDESHQHSQANIQWARAPQ